MIQLRAALRLVRVAERTGRSDATARLRDIYDSFTEGFDTPDLVEARALLHEAGMREA